MQESPSSRRVTARVGGAFGLIYFQISKQSRTEGNYTRIEHEANTQQGNTMPRSKKDIQVIKEVKRALDAALADGVISKDAFALIDSPGLQRRTQSSSWEDWLQAPEPKPEPEPEPEREPQRESEPEPEPASVDIPAPEIAPEPEPTQEAKCYEAVVVDDCVPEVGEGISCTAAPPEETSEMEPAAMTVDQVEPSGHGRSVAEMVNGTADVQKTGADKEEKDKGFAFTTCFRCGRVDIIQYGNGSLPKKIRGECEVDNGIVMTLCGVCGKTDGGSNGTGSFRLDFTRLRLSPEMFKGSMVHEIAKVIMSQEVAFITEGGVVVYREVNRMVAGLKKDDKVMSVDVERFKEGEMDGLVSGFLAGGLIGPVVGGAIEKKKEENNVWESWARG